MSKKSIVIIALSLGFLGGLFTVSERIEAREPCDSSPFVNNGVCGGAGMSGWRRAHANGCISCQFSVCNNCNCPSCGPSNGGSFASAPSSGLCTAGVPSGVSGSGPWSWTCKLAGNNNGVNCSANKTVTVVNGACGAANGGSYATAPTVGLCTTGTPSAVANGASWTWTCNGSGGGTNDSCSASVIINGTCDVNRTTPYSVAATTWAVGSNWCSLGTAAFPNGAINFPNPGETTANWSCLGSGGGINATNCNASRLLDNPDVTLTAVPASVNLNGGTQTITPKSTTLTWGISNFATACVGGCTCNASNAWGGSKSSLGGSELSWVNTGADPTYTLTCTNVSSGIGSISATVVSSCTPVSWHDPNCSKNCGDGIYECHNINAECGQPNDCADNPCNLGACPVSSEWKEVRP